VSVRRTVLPFLLALALGLAASFLVACGDSGGRGGLIPPGEADAIIGRIDDARSAYAAGDCQEAAQAVRQATRAAENLPQDVDRRLSNRIEEGLGALSDQVVGDCRTDRDAEAEPTGPTGPAEPTGPTGPTGPTTTATPPTTTPDGTGGANPDDTGGAAQ
jgi:hypothetical protein